MAKIVPPGIPGMAGMGHFIKGMLNPGLCEQRAKRSLAGDGTASRANDILAARAEEEVAQSLVGLGRVIEQIFMSFLEILETGTENSYRGELIQVR